MPGAGPPPAIDALLPPLTSSNDVDLQLYALLAVIVREFVQSWYSSITPDVTFVEEVVAIVAHCTRGLEGRLRAVDLEALLFDEMAELVDEHVMGTSLLSFGVCWTLLVLGLTRAQRIELHIDRCTLRH